MIGEMDNGSRLLTQSIHHSSVTMTQRIYCPSTNKIEVFFTIFVPHTAIFTTDYDYRLPLEGAGSHSTTSLALGVGFRAAPVMLSEGYPVEVIA